MIGLRFGVVINSQKFENNEESQFVFNDEHDHAIISFVPTFDYYLNENIFRPYLGLGLGYYLLSDIDLSRNGSADLFTVNVKNKVGFLFRGGFELGKTRVGLEYNFIQIADIEIPEGQIIGTVNNSYFGLSIGFTIGVGKSYL